MRDRAVDPDGSVLFLFKSGRRERLVGPDPFPTEFFYGYCELKKGGLPVDFMDEAELVAAGSGKPPSRLLRAIFGRIFAGLPAALDFALVLARRANLARLNRSSAIVATTNTFGLSLALLRRLGLVRRPVVFIPMGVLPEAASGWRRRLGTWLLRACTLAPLSKVEAAYLAERLGLNGAVHYLPFGVDTGFWTPAGDSGDFVLSIGNDRHRDYRTLVEAWRPHYPRLRIVTRLPVAADQANIEVVRGDWREQVLSDDEVRKMIQASRFVVLPIRDTLQPSGQSACLQAMACGRPVVVSRIRGLSDREVIRDNETCLFVEPGSASSLGRAIEQLLLDGGIAERLGKAARRAVEGRFDTSRMAAAMKAIVSEPAGWA